VSPGHASVALSAAGISANHRKSRCAIAPILARTRFRRTKKECVGVLSIFLPSFRKDFSIRALVVYRDAIQQLFFWLEATQFTPPFFIVN
jgi:hypothetical protein